MAAAGGSVGHVFPKKKSDLPKFRQHLQVGLAIFVPPNHQKKTKFNISS
jgi:hypothetical protein